MPKFMVLFIVVVYTYLQIIQGVYTKYVLHFCMSVIPQINQKLIFKKEEFTFL